MGRYEVLLTDSTCYYIKNTFLMLSKSALTKDNEKDAVLVQLKFKSFYEKKIMALEVLVTGIDLEGKIIEEKPFQYIDLNAGKNEEFGDRTPIYMDQNSVRKFIIRVTRIIFNDEIVEKVDDGECIVVPDKPFPFSGDLKDQYVRTIRPFGGFPKANCSPLKFGSFWKCSCGQINSLYDENCCSCKCSVDSVFDSLDENKLSNDLMGHKEQQEKIAEESKKKQAAFIKKASMICGIAVVLAVIIFAYMKVIAPALSYNKAEKYYQSGDYEKAITEMSNLGDYKDASDQIKKYKYDQATALYEEGDHKKAKEIFKEIGDYSDSQNRYNEIVKEDEYNNAISEMSNGSSEEALSVFEKDLDYRDSAYYAGCINQEDGEYSKAVEQFAKVSSSSEFYKDAESRKKECEKVIQDNLNEMHYEKGIKYAKKGYLYSAKEEFEASNGVNDSADYLRAIQETIDEGWVGIYRSDDSGTKYLGIFCEINSDIEKKYVVVSQSSTFESVYSGAELQDDGSMLLYDTFNDSIDIDYKSGFVDESEYQFQEDKSVYKKRGGTRGTTGGGTFPGRRYKSFVELSKNDEGDITWDKKTEETTEARESYNLAGEREYRPASTETNEESFNYERIGDE